MGAHLIGREKEIGFTHFVVKGGILALHLFSHELVKYPELLNTLLIFTLSHWPILPKGTTPNSL